VWTDVDGISHQSRCELSEFHKAPIQPRAAPQWIGAETRHAATVFVTVLPVGWVGDWHENPQPQWIIPLSGRWFVESMDGVRIEMDPGEISFGEDQNTRQVDGKRGHLSGTVGAEPAVLMLVQFERHSQQACRTLRGGDQSSRPALLRGHAAVQREKGAGGEAAFVAGEEQDAGSDLLGRAEPAEKLARRQRFARGGGIGAPFENVVEI